MAVFIDTSVFSVLDADDGNHLMAARTWRQLLDEREDLVTSNYVLVECFALLQRRLGLEAARVFQSDVVGVLQVRWVDEQHNAAEIIDSAETLLFGGLGAFEGRNSIHRLSGSARVDDQVRPWSVVAKKICVPKSDRPRRTRRTPTIGSAKN